MANYQFLDAYGSVLTAGSSVVGGVNYPVVIVPNGLTIGSVLGSYAGDSAHTRSDVGLGMLAVRNDTLASVISTDTNYSPFVVGPVGEVIVANSPLTKWIQGTGTIVSGTSVQVIAPQGTSIFSYVTAVQVRNDSANNVGITFTGGLGSVLGYTVAPANGGSNITYPNALKTGANSGFSASISGVASVYVAVQGFISKT